MTDEHTASGGGDREMGVEFGDLEERLQDADFPLEHDALLERFGDHELGTPEDSTTLEAVLGPELDREYDSPDEVHQSVLNMIGSDAVGRDRYSDRGLDVDSNRDEQETL